MFVIRQFQPDDMFAVIKIAYTTLPEQYNPSIFNYFYESYPQGFLVAEQHHKLIGFLTSIKTSQTTAKILMLAVIKNHQKQKIGSAILNEFFKELYLTHILKVDLEVRTTNTQAIDFYKKHGFTIIDTIPQFYQNKEDAYIMTKTF